MINPLLVPANEAAKMLSMSRSLYFRLLSSGRIPLNAVRFGAKRLYRVKDIQSFVDSGCSANWKGETK